MINPYKILGVDKNATQDDIKKAYRKLAKVNHPDLNPGNKKAEEKFKEISHANDLIGTAEARAKFDRGEISEEEQQQWQGKRSQRQRPQRPKSNRYSQSFAEEFAGEDLFEDLFKGYRSYRQPKASGDVHYQMPITFKESVVGAEKIITLLNGKKLQVKIPPGITNGAKLRFKNQGNPGDEHTELGDAYIEIQITPLEGWSRVDNDIETEVPISFIEAVLGGEISVPTMYGPVMLQIPAGVSTGSKLRIKGKGVQSGDTQGNQIVKLKVVTPKTITPEMKSAMTNLKGVFNYNPRGEA